MTKKTKCVPNPSRDRPKAPLDASSATVDPSGQIVEGAQTGAGTVSWEAEGRGGTLPIVVLPPDWVP